MESCIEFGMVTVLQMDYTRRPGLMMVCSGVLRGPIVMSLERESLSKAHETELSFNSL